MDLNTAWIEKYFEIEPKDLSMLYRAKEYIEKGAMIYFAVEDGQGLATCTVTPHGVDFWGIF